MAILSSENVTELFLDFSDIIIDLQELEKLLNFKMSHNCWLSTFAGST